MDIVLKTDRGTMPRKFRICDNYPLQRPKSISDEVSNTERDVEVKIVKQKMRPHKLTAMWEKLKKKRKRNKNKNKLKIIKIKKVQIDLTKKKVFETEEERKLRLLFNKIEKNVTDRLKKKE